MKKTIKKLACKSVPEKDLGAFARLLPKAAVGLMQLIPDTAERFSVRNAFDATQNLRGGMRYLRWLLSYYRGNVSYALAAYNAGEGRVDRYRGALRRASRKTQRDRPNQPQPRTLH